MKEKMRLTTGEMSDGQEQEYEHEEVRKRDVFDRALELGHAVGQKREEDLRAVERRDRNEVEEREHYVDDHDDGRDADECGSERSERAAEPDAEAKNDGKEDVDHDAGARHEERPPSAIPEIALIIWNGLGPADDEARIEEHEKEREDDGANPVNVLEGVQGQAAGIAGGRIALGIRGEAVSHLMDDDGHDEHHYIE